MKVLYFIVNPQAKNGRCQKVWHKIEKVLERRNVSFQVFFTKGPGHAAEIANKLGQQNEGKETVIGVVGGDGTIHEVMNGISCHPHLKIGFIPGGSGNDFSRGFRIPRNPLDALDFFLRLAGENPVFIDMGKISHKESGEIFFINNMGAGFDAFVATKVNHSPLKKVLNRLSLGKLTYVYVMLKHLFTYRCTQLTLLIDGRKHKIDNAWFVTVSNQPYFGGGMKIAPQANTQDGLMDITVVHNLARWKLLFLFATVFWGKHLGLKEVATFKGKEISIISDQEIYVHAGGEYVGKTPVSISVFPKKAPILAELGKS